MVMRGFKSRKFILSLVGVVILTVLTSMSFVYHPELVVGLAGILAGIITAYIAGNVVQDYSSE
jgi:hypothetical protein